MSGRPGNFLAGSSLALLVGLAFLVSLLEPPPKAPEGSVASTEDEGRRAHLLLLSELGFPASAWRELPGALPRGGDVLWLSRPPKPWRKEVRRPKSAEDEPQEPSAAPPAEEPAPEAGDATPPALDLHRLAHYRRFVEEGGRLVLRAGADSRRFLVDVLGIEECAGVAVLESAEAGPRRARSAGGGELDVDIAEGGALALPVPGSPASVLWKLDVDGGAMEEVLALSVPVGRGEIVLLGDDTFLDNGKLGLRDHALFAVRLAEELARGGRILFDEFALGLVEPRTAADLALSPALRLVTLNVALLLLLLAWRAAWVREFPRDPEPLEAFSPLARARATAGLLERAGRFEAIARMLREGVARSLDRRARAGAEVGARLGRRACTDARDLEDLGRALRDLEGEIDARAGAPASRARAG